MKLFLFVIAVVFLAFSPHAQDLDKYGVVEEGAPSGIEVGDTIENLTLYFLSGDVINLHDYVSSKPTVVLFYRGEWCPVCMRYLSNLSDSLSLIEEKANVIVVAPEIEENMKKTKENSPTFTFVLDSNEAIMKAFDVMFDVTEKYQKKISTFLKTDIAEHNGEDAARLPVPATYMLDENGVILFRHFDFNYKVRATASQILDALPKE